MNAALALRLAGEAGVTTFDLFGLGTQIAANPALFGFSNVSDACGAVSGANCDQYAYWDGIHPTAAAHRVIADAFLAVAVPEPETWVLLAGGLAALGAISRRRADGRPAGVAPPRGDDPRRLGAAQQFAQRARDDLRRAGAGRRARGARRRAWRSIRAPCAARRRRSPPARRPRRRGARRCRAAFPTRGSASPNTASPCRLQRRDERARCPAAACSARASSSRRTSTRDAGPSRRRLGDHLAQRSPRPRPGPPRESCGGRAGARPCPGTTLVLVPPAIVPTFRYGCVMPATCDVTLR